MFSRLVEGYRVTVKVGSETFVYHTDNNSRVILNETASRIIDNQTTVVPVKINSNQLPSPLSKQVVFRQITSGGFTGKTYETVLLEDGRIISNSQFNFRQVSRQQVNDFQRLLQRQRDQFNNLSYPISQGAADYITYTLSSRNGTVEYNDTTRNQLPEDLVNVLEAWNRILNS
ncbi:MAG: hypothetical protein HC917_06650 [Richelia sp. SM2_1_7]|nr:hypothetical protein [Richelia sp. SM2_1_7]